MESSQQKIDGEVWATLARWIEGFLSSKHISSPRRIIEWWSWAHRRLELGWTPEAIRDHIVRAWKTWVDGGNVDAGPMEPEILQAMADVLEMAEKGATPEQCAVVYRSLAKQYPNHYWLSDWAARWDAAGSDWKAVVLP